jgi:hypothetical protein
MMNLKRLYSLGPVLRLAEKVFIDSDDTQAAGNKHGHFFLQDAIGKSAQIGPRGPTRLLFYIKFAMLHDAGFQKTPNGIAAGC